MSIINDMNSVYKVFYLQGLEARKRPGKGRVLLKKSELMLFTERISLQSITDIKIDYEVKDQQGSIGRAVAGGIIAGGAGAVVGGLGNKKKVEPALTITYLLKGEPAELVLIAEKAELIDKDIKKRVEKLKK